MVELKHELKISVILAKILKCISVKSVKIDTYQLQTDIF